MNNGGKATHIASLRAWMPKKDVIMQAYRNNDESLSATARHLNRIGIKTPHGFEFYPQTVKRAIKLLGITDNRDN